MNLNLDVLERCTEEAKIHPIGVATNEPNVALLTLDQLIMELKRQQDGSDRNG